MPTLPNRRAKICPYCGVLLDPEDSKCFQCGTEFSSPQPSGFQRWLAENFQLQGEVTKGILLVTVLIFAVTWLLSEIKGKSDIFMSIDLKVLDEFGAKNTLLMVEKGELWRLVTAIFLHANLLHIFFNMWAFVQIGFLVEQIYGWQRYCFFYIFSGAMGYVASSIFYPNVMSIGASGAIMGLIGVLLAYSVRNWKSHGRILGKRLLFWVFFILFYGYVIPNIDNAAHIGGLLSGFLVALPFKPEPPANLFQKIVDETLGWGTVLLVVGCFLFMGFSH
jgi:membrane associated rhomboid family serine protease